MISLRLLRQENGFAYCLLLIRFSAVALARVAGLVPLLAISCRSALPWLKEIRCRRQTAMWKRQQTTPDNAEVKNVHLLD